MGIIVSSSLWVLQELCHQPADDINPALPLKGIYHNTHALGSLRQCRIYLINSSLRFPSRVSKGHGTQHVGHIVDDVNPA